MAKGKRFTENAVKINPSDMNKENPAHSGLVVKTIGTGGIASIEIVNPGGKHAEGGFITFTGGGGKDANASFTIDKTKKIDSVTIHNPGSGYTSAPKAKVANSTATFSVVMGGRCGRVQYETLVAMGSE